MQIVKLTVPKQIFMPIAGHFCHVHASQGQVYLAGGAARGVLQHLLQGGKLRKPNDYDWTVVGRAKGSISLNRAPKGPKRIEVEDGAPHATLTDYMASRDFGINEVAIDSKGCLYATKIAIESFKSGILLARPGQLLTPREAVRACRFCLEYSLKMPAVIRNQVIAFRNDGSLREEAVYSRYLRTWDLDPFIDFL